MKLLNKNIVLFLTFYSIAFIIGYDSLNRFDYDNLLSKNGSLSDISTYKQTVEKGFEGFSEEKRLAPRFITPILSNIIFDFFEGKIRSWEPVFFSLLVVNSFFVSMTCLVMTFYVKYLKIKFTFAPQLLFFGSFGVCAFFLSGLIDASVCFFIFFYIFNFIRKKYFFSWILAILMCLSKETSFIYLIIFHVAFILNEIIFERKIRWEDLAFPFLSILSNLIIVNFYISNFLNLNLIEYISFFQEKGGAMNYKNSFIDLVKFSFFLAPFIFFTYIGLKEVNKKFSSLFLLCLIMLFIFLIIIIDMDGNGMGRYMFNFLGPMFCLVSGVGLKKYIEK